MTACYTLRAARKLVTVGGYFNSVSRIVGYWTSTCKMPLRTAVMISDLACLQYLQWLCLGWL